MDLSNYTVIKASDLTELTTLEDSYYVIATNSESSKKIKASLLKGERGDSPIIQIGDVVTLSEGSNATASISEISNNTYAINFGIPRGDKGLDGESADNTYINNVINDLNSKIEALTQRIEYLENLHSTEPTVIRVQSVTLSNNSLSLNIGDKTTLTANVYPSNATNKNVTWSSNNQSVITVSSNGEITAVNSGNATITVTTVDGNYTATCSITVSDRTISVTGVSLSTHSVEMSSIGETYTINYTISPTNATNKNITWSSSAPTVATIEDHLITAKGDGTAIISIRTVDGGYSDTCTVTVDTSAVVAGSYVTDENGNRLMTEDGSYLITD